MAPQGAARRANPFLDGDALEPSLTGDLLTLTDLTAQPRFGIKGPGSASWVASQIATLPPVNRIGDYQGLRLLRLGQDDFLFLAPMDGAALDHLMAAWAGGSGQRGYSYWREEGWAWIRLAGSLVEDAMARLCALDLREGRFAEHDIAQTRVGQLEAVLIRGKPGFDIFFDIIASAHFFRSVAAVVSQIGGSKPDHRRMSL